MIAEDHDTVSAYLLTPPRTLREACRRTGHDGGGTRCPTCPIRDLCVSDERWLVRLASPPRPGSDGGHRK